MQTKTIKILGTGCPSCKRAIAVVEEVVTEHHIDARVEKVEDIAEIMKYNVMTTPAIVVDEKVVLKGRVPSKDEVLALLKP